MKKMTINTLAFGNFKQRHKQYTIMIVGIILAMVFSSSVVFMASAMYNSSIEMRNERFGKESVIWANVTEDDIKKAKDNKILGDSGYAHILGSLYSTDKDYYDQSTLAWVDDKAMELSNPNLIEGKMPSKENEIAIERMMLSKLGITANVGDNITFNFKTQNGNDVLDNSHQVTYKLVGILKNKVNNISFTSGIDANIIPSAFVCKNTNVELGGKEGLLCYARFYNNKETQSNYKNLDNYINSSDEYSRNLIATISYHDNYSTNDNAIYNIQEEIIFIVIIISVLMIASCLIIINSFNSNLNERKKQIGLLRAIGTTKRQIINIFAREAFIISLIATPISCIVSVFVVKIIIKFLGDGYFFNPSLWAFVVSILFCIACVMLSALIPLISASRISPIQAIRNIEHTRRINKKHIKSKDNFDVSKLIAKRSLIFGKGKQATVSIILIISVIASGFAFSWYSYSANSKYSVEYDYQLFLSGYTNYAYVNYKSSNDGYTEYEKNSIANNKYIGKSNGVKIGISNMLIPSNSSEYRQYLSNNYLRDFNNYSDDEINETNYKDALFSEKENSLNFKKSCELLKVDDFISTDFISFDSQYIESLNQYVYDGEIDINKINSGEEIILYAPSKVGMYYDDSKYGGLMIALNSDVDMENCFFKADCDFHAGDEIEIAVINADAPADEEGENDDHTIIPDNAKITKKKVKIGAIINNVSYGNSSSLQIVTSTSVMNYLIPNMKYKELNFNLNTSCTDEIEKAVVENINEITSNVEQSNYTSNYGFAQQQREEINKIIIAMMAIIILLFIISISIINNTISACIRNSKQKIGTLRAVGADEKELVKSYFYQLLSMLMWGTGLGLFGFFGAYTVLFIIQKINDSTLEMICNPLVAIIFVLLAFFICSVNLWLKIRKEMKNSIVENIREL